MLSSIVGAVIAVLLFYVERKYISKQDVKNNDYLRIGLLGFIVTYLGNMISGLFTTNATSSKVYDDDIMTGRGIFWLHITIFTMFLLFIFININYKIWFHNLFS